MGTDKSNSRRGIERRFGAVRITCLILASVLALVAQSSGSANRRAAIVVENTANKGIDTLLANVLISDLGYDVRWITPDTVAIRNSAYFDTAFDVVIWCGVEVAAPTPTTVCDTITNSRAGMVSLLGDTWDEINLGVNSNGTSGRTAENAGFVRAINRDHWITQVLQDTVYLWTATSVIIYGLVFPDTCHEVMPLIIDKDNAGDTAFAQLAVADSGDVIINTGDERNVARGRRVFLGLFSVTSTARDSCQYYTIFTRAVAWAAGDTTNVFLNRNACFSGRIEVEDAWGENSSGSDSLESYGGWGSLYTGFDFDCKVAFMQIKNDALQRKLRGTQSLVESFSVRTKLLSVSNDPADSLWESTNGIKLIKQKWVCGNATGQSNTNFVSWSRRYIADPDTFRWSVGGAFDANVDVVDTVLDSIHQSRANTLAGISFHWTIPNEFAARMIRDTTNNHGWVWQNYWNNQAGQINDAEIIYHSSEANAVADRPLIVVRLGDAAIHASRRRWHTISNGLIGGTQ